jgi:hypothetical protein
MSESSTGYQTIGINTTMNDFTRRLYKDDVSTAVIAMDYAESTLQHYLKHIQSVRESEEWSMKILLIGKQILAITRTLAEEIAYLADLEDQFRISKLPNGASGDEGGKDLELLDC